MTTETPTPKPRVQRPPVNQQAYNGVAVTALLLGLVGLFFCVFVVTGFLGVALGGIGTVFGVVGVMELWRSRSGVKLLAVAGLVVAVSATLLGVVTTAITLSVMNTALSSSRDAGRDAPAGTQASPGQPPARRSTAATWGQRYTWRDGVAVEVSVPTPYLPGPSAVGAGVRNVVVEVTVVNGTGQTYTYDWNTFGPARVTFDGRPVKPLIEADRQVGGVPLTHIPPGKSLTTVWAFPVAPTRGELRMQFTEVLGSPAAVFLGLA